MPGADVTALRASNILVTVKENIPNPSDLGVKFVDLYKKPDGTIIGYIQIFTAYGKNVSGQEGYHAIKVTLDYPKNKLPTVRKGVAGGKDKNVRQ